MVNVGECPVTVNRVFSWEHLHHSAMCVFFVNKHYWKSINSILECLGNITLSRLAFVILLVYWGCGHVTLLTEKNNMKAQ